MKYAKLMLIICLCLFAFVSCKDSSYYFDNVDTGTLAVIDESQNNTYGIDHLIINDEHYSLVKDDSLNIIHAYGDIEILQPFANFGKDGSYTLYEIKTDLPFKVYIDNKNKAVFCLDENVDACREYFLSDVKTEPMADIANEDGSGAAAEAAD